MADLSRQWQLRLKNIFPVSILFVLLTFLLWQSQAHSVSNHYAIVDSLRHLERKDIIVVNDMLEAQAQLSQSYDPLTQHTDAFRQEVQTIAGLFSSISPTESLHQHLRELKEVSERRNIFIEDFKSDDAVLNNSLEYFPGAVAAFLTTLDRENSSLYDHVVRLQTAVFQYQNITANDSLIELLEEDIVALKKSPTPTAQIQASSLQNLLTHGRLIFRVQPEVKEQIVNLTNASTHQAIETLSESYKAYYLKQSTVKNYYRFGLYITSVVLFIYSLVLYRHYRQTQTLKVLNVRLEQLVTERTAALRQTLKTLKQSQTQLIHAEKMSSLGQLVAGIAHEINNPVNFIHGNLNIAQRYSQDLLLLTQLYKQHYCPTPDIKEFEQSIDLNFLAEDYPKLLSSMRIGTRRVQEIVNSMRTFSRLDEAKRRPTNIHEGLDSTLLILRHRLTPKDSKTEILVQRNYDDDIPDILVCPGHLNQVFMNLLVNAIDALESSDLFGSKGYQPTIVIRTESQADSVSIFITDNGPGIPEAVKPKLFEPFFTTKPVGKGTGLGLSISYHIVTEIHQGTLNCHSNPNTGTEFCIRLPRPSSEVPYTSPQKSTRQALKL